MRFSQRIGKIPAAKLAQRDFIDEDLRNSLWNALHLHYWSKFVPQTSYSPTFNVRGSNLESLITNLWVHYFKQPADTINSEWENCLARLRQYFVEAPWNQVFDFIEAVAEYGVAGRRREFERDCNLFLERENSAYRFVNGQIVEITSAEEIEAVETAVLGAGKFIGVATHLAAALSLLSDRTTPDYRNSIKESISAVESLAKQIAGEQSTTLGTALKTLERSHSLHPALKSAFSSLYGYTSDSHGIRHALMDEDKLTKADAKFMLVCCSAFVNYVIQLTNTE